MIDFVVHNVQDCMKNLKCTITSIIEDNRENSYFLYVLFFFGWKKTEIEFNSNPHKTIVK